MNISPQISTIESASFRETFLDFLKDQNLKNIDIGQIEFACEEIESDFQKAEKKRKNGEGYESHPYEVTRLFIGLGQRSINTNTLIACLLHDHIEDITGIDYQHIEKKFNPEVAFLVHILSKPKIESNESDITQEQREELKRKRNDNFFQNFQSLENLQAYIQREALKLGHPLHHKYKEGKKMGGKRRLGLLQLLKYVIEFTISTR